MDCGSTFLGSAYLASDDMVCASDDMAVGLSSA